jgi:integrase
LFPRPQAGAFLLGPAGSPLAYTTVAGAFRRLLDLAGVHAGTGQPRPGIHSLRHTFAVATLTGWYRDGADVASLLPLLSTYMGHTDPRSTYYYLQACPELLALAAARLQDAPGEPQ